LLSSPTAPIPVAAYPLPLSRLPAPTVNPYRIKSKGSPYSITKRRVPELIPILGSQPAVDVSHKPGGRLPLLSARLAVTPATLKRAAANSLLGVHQQRQDGCEQFA